MAAELKESCIAIISNLMNQKIGFPILPPPTSSGTLNALRDLSTHNDLLNLSTYDKLQELTYQRHLLEAEVEALHDVLTNDSMDLDDTENIESIKKEGREIQGKMIVKDLVVTQLASTRPIVRSIHSGPHRTNMETDLLPLLTNRDLLATTLIHLTSQLSTLQEAHNRSSAKLTSLTKSNKSLAEQLKQLSLEHEISENITTNEKLIAAKEETMKAQRQCRTLKGVLQGIIAGSGVDWAEDDILRELVLECGDD
ncbi:hypothetical protein TWF569_000986 [Orbilia oligospora]|uniref:Centromere protein H C-terminal domain-containing protein n=1 Tax=Orbilia oligospora TaxID=2813651 RepID=A0A7C8N1B2_ORBOL|nr:hypothetical protein TWF102_008885 [Orbilia oligospora]KAF3097810.1 hypothetical protein TWF103_009207 [Orbilia oligospora]KAF3131457.1 hypothetical protein TWF594_009812 [Orbilia oligospora]KAF3154161.1 hypothetical protein TWF569_000986 [Orbilia oligospora]KAF3158683.1 hypothetical protein TWF751_001330 [Orbilia oligospora]